MPVQILNNYPESDLDKYILNQNGIPLYGEIWVYKQFLNINRFNLLENETWYLKHNFDLSQHPGSKRKKEGQIDFLLLSRYGLLVIEVKGGGLRVDEDDRYYSSGATGEYETQNPFLQAKEYVHSLKYLLDTATFTYRAVILPHEAGFKLIGPQLSGYKDFFFSKAQFDGKNERGILNEFFKFISGLGKSARRWSILANNPSLKGEVLDRRMWEDNPELNTSDIRRLKSELFPQQDSYGYDPEKVDKELILNENYQVMQGLRRNRMVLIQGAPGTGKTTLALKYLAESLMKNRKVVYVCANRLIQSRLEHSIKTDYRLDTNSVLFMIYTFNRICELKKEENWDFFIFDEAQEYFQKGLYDATEYLNENFNKPGILILYDPEQAIISESLELGWFTDYFIENGFSHFLFDINYRCAQHPSIVSVSDMILHHKGEEIIKKMGHLFSFPVDKYQFMSIMKDICDDKKYTVNSKIVLIHTEIYDSVSNILSGEYRSFFEELTADNINISSQRIRYTTPIKYRGMENDAVYLITKGMGPGFKVQNYVGVTRAMNLLKIIIWNP
jgi:hypothetical protein